MKKKYKTVQEKFWAESFGNKYIRRNILSKDRSQTIGHALRKNNLKIISALELGCNVGYNLDALKKIFKKIKLYGVEINKLAFDIANKKYNCFNKSILDYKSKKKYDLVFTAGVLIHQNPKYLNKIYKRFIHYQKNIFIYRIF